MAAFKELGIEIGSPYEYRREIAACKIAKGWVDENSVEYSVHSVDFNSRFADYAPTLYENNQLVFTSDRKSASGEDTYNWTGNDFSDLFVTALTTDIVDPFDGIINTPDNEGTAVFNSNFTEMYFTRCIGDKKEDYYCKLMFSERTGSKWTIPVVLPFVESGVNYGHPALSADGQTLYFSCNSKDGWGGYDIWYCQRTADGWGETKRMGRTINTIGNEKVTNLDGDPLYFSPSVPSGMGGLDLDVHGRVGPSGREAEKNLKPPINSGSDDFGFVVNYNAEKSEGVLQTGYFSSNRPDGAGSDDIYRFEKRLPPPTPPKPEPPLSAYKMILDGYVLEKIFAQEENPDSKMLGRKPLSGAEVKVYFGKKTKTFTVGDDGHFTFELEENTLYNIQAAKKGFLKGETGFSTVGIGRDPENPVQTFEVEIVLDKIYLNKEIVLEDIYYDFDKWDIRSDARPTLDKLVRNLELNPRIRIQLASHTDCRGNDGYNEDLSQKRAQSAVNYIISKGISADRLLAKGYGESVPKVNCVCARCTEEEHQLNRRTTFTILE